MEAHRRLTLLDQMMMSAPTAATTTNGGGRALTGLTLEDILTSSSPNQPPPPPEMPASISGRTLLDIIRAEQPNKAYSVLIGKKQVNKRAWEALKDRLRLKKASAALLRRRHVISHVTPDPMPEDPADNPSTAAVNHPSRRSSGGYSPAADDGGITRRRLESLISEEVLLAAREAVPAAELGSGESSGLGESQAVRMSLMELLDETDRQMGMEGMRYATNDYEEEEEEEVAVAAVEGGGGGVVGGGGVEHGCCCVCMVRLKGSAFIPCGHTFCRMCSRELWVQRGNCPLCNNSILEILDIF